MHANPNRPGLDSPERANALLRAAAGSDTGRGGPEDRPGAYALRAAAAASERADAERAALAALREAYHAADAAPDVPPATILAGLAYAIRRGFLPASGAGSRYLGGYCGLPDAAVSAAVRAGRLLRDADPDA
jgi:hypothetical protein